MSRQITCCLKSNSRAPFGMRFPLLLLIFFCVQSADSLLAKTVPAQLSAAQSSQQNTAIENEQEAVTTLELDKPIERELAGGEKHAYQIQLAAGQFIRLTVTQKGIDVGVNFQLPDGEITKPFEPFGGQPALSVSWVAAATGNYRVEIYARAKAPAGRYEIRLAEIRPATENDRALQQARDLFTEFAPLLREGKHLEARPLLKRILEIREKVLGPDDLLVAETLDFLSGNYASTGDYPSAEPLKLRALKIFEKRLGADHPRVALELVQLAGFYAEKGDDLKAEEADQRALTIYERAQQAENPAVGSLLAGLGNIYYNRGDDETAEKYYERSRAVWEKLLGADHFHLAPSYTYLGRVAYDRGDYQKSAEMFQRALALAEKGLGTEHTGLTRYLNDLASVYIAMGDYAMAESLYLRALSIHERNAAMGRTEVQETLFGLAQLSAAQGRVTDAIKFQSRASEIEERYISLNLAAGSEREKLAFLDNLTSRLSRDISLHNDLAPNDATARDLAATTILQRKGRVQDALSTSLTALRLRFNTEDRKLLDQLNDVTSRLATLVLNGAQKLTPAQYEEQTRALEEQREKLEDEIAERSAGFYARSQTVTLDAVRKIVPDNAALIEFAVYRPFNPKAPNNRAFGEPRYIAYVIRHERDVAWKELGDARTIDAALFALRQALREPSRNDIRELARSLDEKVMQPLRAFVGDASHLLISPDGELNLIPFEALIDERGDYLVEHYAFTYLTSGRDLLRMQVARESGSNPLVVADPSFGEPSGNLLATTNPASKQTASRGKHGSVTTGRTLSEVYFAPLNATAQEARAIQSLFADANLLTGAQATESAIKRATAPRILHIATHGFFLGDESEDRAQVATRGASAHAMKRENPLLRSGLALAGANSRHGGDGNDGILTALEATGLNLWGTKLVVLSACDTGVGEVRNGEGIYGLRRAFTLAGAESLVMSLWPASDYSTREMMTNYYKYLKEGRGRGAALREVQLDLLKRHPHLHPFYWANFIQAGEWANLNGQR